LVDKIFDMSENLNQDKEHITDNSHEILEHDDSGPAQMSTTTVREKRKLIPSTRAMEASTERVRVLHTRNPPKKQKASKSSATRRLMVPHGTAEMEAIDEEEDEGNDLPHDSSDTVMYGTAEDFENMTKEQLEIFERLLKNAKEHHAAVPIPIQTDTEKGIGVPAHDPRVTRPLPQIPRVSAGRRAILDADTGESGPIPQQRQPLYTSLTGGYGGLGLAGVPLHVAGGSHVQGTLVNRPVAVQGQIDRLKLNPSFKAYAENNKAQAKIFEEALGLRDLLILTHANFLLLLQGVIAETLADQYPSYFAETVEHAHNLEQAIKLSDETINSLSEQMMYPGLGISPNMESLKNDIDLHNALNPNHQLDIKKIKDLQEMSNKVERENAKMALVAGGQLRPPIASRFRFQRPIYTPSMQLPVGQGGGYSGGDPTGLQGGDPARFQGGYPASFQGSMDPARLQRGDPGWLGFQGGNPSRFSGSLDPTMMAQRDANVLCFNCQKFGHYANHCPNPRAPRPLLPHPW
jgi:hypothetical protein